VTFSQRQAFAFIKAKAQVGFLYQNNQLSKTTTVSFDAKSQATVRGCKRLKLKIRRIRT
jgi:hypothetical protein